MRALLLVLLSLLLLLLLLLSLSRLPLGAAAGALSGRPRGPEWGGGRCITPRVSVAPLGVVLHPMDPTGT